MNLDNKFLVEEYMNETENVYRFDNIFKFISFCYCHKLTIDNSIVYYDNNKNYMYIKKI